MSVIPIARRAEAIGRGPGPWKEAPDPNNGVGGMAKPFKLIVEFSPDLPLEFFKHKLVALCFQPCFVFKDLSSGPDPSVDTLRTLLSRPEPCRGDLPSG